MLFFSSSQHFINFVYCFLYIWFVPVIHSHSRDLGYGKWKKPQITWTISRYPDIRKHPKLSRARLNLYVRDSMIKALKIWSRAVPVKFIENVSDNAQIKVSFYSVLHDDNYPFDGAGGELAHAFYPDEKRRGQIHIDDEEPWSPDGGRNLEWTLAHELGHVLGIPHLSAPSLMQEGYRGYLNDPRLSLIDINAARKLYSSNANVSHRIYDSEAVTAFCILLTLSATFFIIFGYNRLDWANRPQERFIVQENIPLLSFESPPKYEQLRLNVK